MPRYAAVDIGSNSVRMLAAEVVSGQIEVLAEERQVTRLGESVFAGGQISKDALQLLCQMLSRMYAVYSKLAVSQVRVVATSAVRDASNQDEFLTRTSEAVHAPVEIISGTEEARLIHAGVVARWPRLDEKALLIDVGGGSAELIVSRNDQMGDAVSRPLGAVRLTQMFLKSDPPAREELKRMASYIDEKLLPFRDSHRGERFDRTVVTSATAGAIVAAVNSVARDKREQADRLPAQLAQVRDLYKKISRASVSERRKIPGIGPRRAEIVVAGTAVFLRAMELFDLPEIHYCTAGVREGIVADLASRAEGMSVSHLDPEQHRLMEEMAHKYAVKPGHARQVALIAGKLFSQLSQLHLLPPDAGRLLESAAYLHDIGHFVSNTGHHKHSAYLVDNSDMPGFTDRERTLIAVLCRFHRRSLPQARHLEYQQLDNEAKRVVLRLTPLLRLADALDRSHVQRASGVTATLGEGGGAVVTVSSDTDIELEVWSANQGAAQAFREVYGAALTVQAAASVPTKS